MSQRGRVGGKASRSGRRAKLFSRPRKSQHGSKQFDDMQDDSESDIDSRVFAERSSESEHEDDTFAGKIDFDEGK
jgi:hypothetical protein